MKRREIVGESKEERIERPFPAVFRAKPSEKVRQMIKKWGGVRGGKTTDLERGV